MGTWFVVATIYIWRVVIDPGVIAKLNTKHQVTEPEVEEALQWPSRPSVALDDDPDLGRRWIAKAVVANGRPLLAVLLPAQAWAGDQAEDWVVKTAYWV